MASRSKSKLADEPIPKLIGEYSVPAILSFSIMAAYNFISTYFIGNYEGDVGVAALTVVLPVMLVTAAIAMWVGQGGTAATALRLGEGKQDEAEQFLGSNLLLATLVGIVLGVLGNVFLEPILYISGSTESIYPYAETYTRIFLFGMFIQFPALSLANFVRVDGSPNMALFANASGLVVNILANNILVVALGYGIRGTAFATVLANLATLITVLVYFNSNKSILKFKRRNIRINPPIIKVTLQLGIASFAMQIAASIVMLLLNAQTKVFGALHPIGADAALAGIGTSGKIISMIVTVAIGVGMAFQPIAGFNYGAKLYGRVKEAFKISWIIGMSVMTVSWLLIMFKAEFLISIFGLTGEVQLFSAKVLRIMSAFLPIIPIQILGSSYFQATGQPLKSMVMSLTRQILLYIPFLYILPASLPQLLSITPLESVAVAMPLSDLISVLIVAVFMIKEFKKLNLVIEETQCKHAPAR
ncbi:MAG: MATE family efflux transporter [Coriobacteriia bacterium]|nr:MATE family efflux transporter [Coriobacteriia bacterium]